MKQPVPLTLEDFSVSQLEGTPFENPTQIGADDGLDLWVDEHNRILYRTCTGKQDGTQHLSFQAAGLHRRLHFKPEETTIGIVSCGGLCPGLNDVIKSVVYQALDMYSVKRVIGFRYGYFGLTKEGMKHTMILDHQVVANAHLQGGTILGTSRGPQDADEMVGTLVQCQVDVLICIGGDGTQKGALKVAKAIQKRGLDIAVVGIPKTIDNDIAFIDRTFGFDTAVQEAVKALKAGLCEARSHLYGIGLVKLMGRHAGFIAAQAALASQAAHICLIPEHEISFETICELVERRFERRTYCVIVVAEGFGQRLLDKDATTDASGNKKLGDIGVFLRDKLTAWLKANKAKYGDSTLKYIDPSYTIRSCPASSNDAAFCVQLANCAVHEAMFGSTGCLIGFWAGSFTKVPVELATKVSKRVDLQGMLWRSVREVTVSKRRGRLGASEEDQDLVNAALVSQYDDEFSVPRLTKRVEDLERLISSIRTQESRKDTEIQAMKRYTAQLESQVSQNGAGLPRRLLTPSVGDLDEGDLLEALERKYSRMKERMYKR
eukprot:GGOE01002534.1.p1 GENE.GGOE01002534.1~~GGOE01002534.1.p1  ORF type:complete len:569 (-),score=120.46 GGOE01002534.1:339-1979(-)